jgi:hypothetical protein
MPVLSGKYDPGIGIVMNVCVLPLGGLADESGAASKLQVFPALVDTGASTTCISPAVAAAVGLTPIGMKPMISATQSVPTNVYMADLILPFGAAGYAMPSAQLMEFAVDGSIPFQMLLGRDILCRGALTVSFDGHFTFSI